MADLRGIFKHLAPRRGFAGGPAPVPEEMLLVLGDIHGRADLLEEVLSRRDRLWPGARLVTLGDYIDRGPGSAAVLRLLQGETGPLPPRGGADAQGMAEQAKAPADDDSRAGAAAAAGAPGAGTETWTAPGAICLAGNHEAMLLAFLDDPETNGPGWLRSGGVETLASFGLDACMAAREGARTAAGTKAGDGATTEAGARVDGGVEGQAGSGGTDGPPPAGVLTALRDGLRAAMGGTTEAWLRALPLWWQSGDLAMVHAGADPALPFPAQLQRSLLWGHPDFRRIPRRDGIWVAYGHKIHPMAEMGEGRIALDTGAYATGRLSHALIAPGRIELHST